MQLPFSNPICFVLLAGLLAAGGCRRGESEEVLEVWGWDIAAQALKDLTPGFEQSPAGVKTDVVMSGSDMESRLLLSFVARTGAPDITQLQNRDVPRFAPSGSLLDLTEQIAPYTNRFPAAYLDSCTHEGRIYAVPWDAGPCAVFYKRSVFEKHGIDPASIETWDDYIAAGKKIVRESNGKTRMMNLSLNGLLDIFLVTLQQNGGGIFDSQGRIIFNSQRTAEALQLVRDLLESGITAPVANHSQEYFASFKNNTIATYPMAVWIIGMMKENAPETSGDWGIFSLPAFEKGGLRTSNLGGSVLAIPADTSMPAAAWKFVEFMLCRADSQTTMLKTYGLFPALELEDLEQVDPFFGGQDIVEVFARNIDQISPMERTGDWDEAARYIKESLSGWANRNEPHEVFMKRIEQMLVRKLGREAVADE
jgi:ABC-type glycerol-3-phosphate transport system substrate-binding protein